MEQDRTVGESRQRQKIGGNNEWNRTGLQGRADRERRKSGNIEWNWIGSVGESR
jgi:hypothetical protein